MNQKAIKGKYVYDGVSLQISYIDLTYGIFSDLKAAADKGDIAEIAKTFTDKIDWLYDDESNAFFTKIATNFTDEQLVRVRDVTNASLKEKCGIWIAYIENTQTISVGKLDKIIPDSTTLRRSISFDAMRWGFDMFVLPYETLQCIVGTVSIASNTGKIVIPIEIRTNNWAANNKPFISIHADWSYAEIKTLTFIFKINEVETPVDVKVNITLINHHKVD